MTTPRGHQLQLSPPEDAVAALALLARFRKFIDEAQVLEDTESTVQLRHTLDRNSPVYAAFGVPYAVAPGRRAEPVGIIGAGQDLAGDCVVIRQWFDAVEKLCFQGVLPSKEMNILRYGWKYFSKHRAPESAALAAGR